MARLTILAIFFVGFLGVLFVDGMVRTWGVRANALEAESALHKRGLKISGVNYLTGKNEDYSSLRKPLVVAFLSAKCPCSASHMGHLAELAKTFSGFQFIGLHSNQDESQDGSKDFFLKTKLPFPVIRDDGARIADEFGALKTPHVFVVASGGTQLYAGPVTDSSEFSNAHSFYLKDTLAAIRSGQTPPSVTKRPLGCYIAR
jgi:hypothetical protein